MSAYFTKTAKQLIEDYCFEHDRICREDAEVTQNLIKEELRQRFEGMMTLLDYPELADHPERIYEYFTREYSRR